MTVDLEYPEEKHDLHSDYPLAPEKMLIEYDMLSPYQQGLKEDLNYRNLKLYLKLGMKLTVGQESWPCNKHANVSLK